MSAFEFEKRNRCQRFGLKGPRAAEWLEARGITLPAAPNQWTAAVPAAAGDATPSANANTAAGDELLVARLGTSEFFLEEVAGEGRLRGLESALDLPQTG